MTEPIKPDPIKVARFWASLTIQSSGCWEWTQGKSDDGYGVLKFDGRHFRAHRLAFTLISGPIPDGMHVCHLCDNPVCCNPQHLWLGTDADNQRDKWAKGRGVVPKLGAGGYHPRAKLTNEQADEIRRIYALGNTSFRKLAPVYGVSDSTIRSIVLGLAYPSEAAA